jgi:hypothetical protein
VSTTEEEAPPPPAERPARSDRSSWYWLLIPPILVPLLPMLYNGTSPTLWGIPRFYWLQLAFVVIGVGCTWVVYQKTKGRAR